MTEKNSESKVLLISNSLLMIVFGLVATVTSIIYLVGRNDTGLDIANRTDNDTSWIISMILILVASVFEIIFGWLGIKKSNDHDKAGYFIVTGIIAAIVMLISMFLYYSIWNLVGLILPVLFIIGGFMLRRLD